LRGFAPRRKVIAPKARWSDPVLSVTSFRLWGVGAIRARRTAPAAAYAASTFPTRQANRQPSPLGSFRLPGGCGFAISLALPAIE
jgi:hypothetical protein